MRLPGRLALVRLGLAAATGAVLTGWAIPGQPAAARASTGISVRLEPGELGAAASPAVPAGVAARGAALEDATTGTLLWSRDLNTKRPIASIAKVMVALVVLRTGRLSQVLTVPAAAGAYAARYGASSAGLHAGDRLTVRQLLAAMLLPSGGDAAYVLADAFGPGLTRFVARMNAAAARLGLGRTHFANFDGLPLPTEYSTYSTPGDVLVIGRAAMAYPVFRAIVSQPSYRLAAGPGHHAYAWPNTDLLLSEYPGAIGIKTGSTAAAGYCLLFEARRGPGTLIGVVLDSSSTLRAVSFSDAEHLLDWGFR
jgi:serine-type D-Ala-D-Ala carboxypeptidase (penicillin-binding protein 5/6)